MFHNFSPLTPLIRRFSRISTGLLLAGFLGLTVDVSRADFTWGNPGSGSWDVSGNWIGNVVPDASSPSIIDNSGTATLGVGVSGTAGSLHVGNLGTGSLLIDGGLVTTGSSVIGSNAGSSGTVTVSSGTLLNTGDLLVGRSGTGSLLVNGGFVTGSNGYIATGTSSNSSATVTSGTWQNIKDLLVGHTGTGSLLVNGGLVTSVYGSVGYAADSTGTATITSGTWHNADTLYVGNAGRGTLVVNGGLMTGTNSILGALVGSSGTATVSSGTWNNNNYLYVGQRGTGALLVNGGLVTGSNSHIGALAGSNGTATVTSGTWNTTSSMFVGSSGTGRLVVNGGQVNSFFTAVGYIGTSSGTATVTSGTWNNSGSIYIGFAGRGSLLVNGGLFTGSSALIGGSAGSNGSATVSSGTWSNESLTIANGGTGSLLVNGGWVTNGITILGAGAGANGTATVSSGTLDSATSIWVGQSGTGSLLINGGAVNTFALTLGFNAGSTGSLTLSGSGVLQANQISKGNGTGTVLFNGGTFRAGGNQSSFLSGFDAGTVTIGASGANIDSNGFALSSAVALSGAGGLTKLGDGTLTLTGSNTYSGSTTVRSGTLAVSGSTARITHASADIVIGTLSGSTAGFSLAGGLVTNRDAHIGAAAGSTGIATVTSGTWNNTAVLYLGNSGTGSLLVNGGLVSSVDSALGMSAGSNGSATVTSGTWNSDLELRVGSSGASSLLINGGLVTSGTGSLGTFAGASGTATVTSGTWNNTTDLAVGRSGTGTLLVNGGSVTSGSVTLGSAATGVGSLTLSGGVLQTSQIAKGAGTGSVLFDGGTLQATANQAALFSGFDAGNVVIGGGGANIDSNGFALSTALALSGTGGLTKLNSGTLTLTGSNTYTGGTTISGGLLQIGTGGTTGSIVGDISNNAELAFNRSDAITYGGVISGTGNVRLLGSGTTTFTGNNTYSGTTFITSGPLQIGNGGSTGSINGNIANDAQLVFNRSNDLTYAGVISGTGHVTKTGAGMLSLTGTGMHTGGTTISGGVLQIGEGGVLTGNLLNNATLAFNRSSNQTFAGIISGTGAVTKSNTNQMTMTGSNSYSGGTTIYTGNMVGNNANAFGTGAITMDLVGATQVVLALTNNTTIANAIVVTGSNAILTNFGTDAVSTFSGPITLAGGNATIRGLSGVGSTTVAGLISGTGNLRLLTGQSVSDTFSSVVVSGSVNHVGSITHTGDFSSGTATISGVIGTNVTGVTQNSAAAALILTGNNTYTGLTTVTSGTLRIGNGGTTGSILGNVSNNGSLVFDRSNAVTYGGAISGNGNVTKLGAGTTTFTGSHSYFGATTVSAGNLAVNGLIANSSVTVGNTATLSGTGSIGGNVTAQNGSTIAAGNSVGTLTVGGNFTFQSGSLFAVEGGGALFDRIDITGIASIVSGAQISFTLLTAPTEVSYTLLTAASGLDGSIRFDLVGSVPTGYGLVYSGTSLRLVSQAEIGTITVTPTDTTIITGGTTSVTVTVENSGATGTPDLEATVTGTGSITGSGTTTVVAGNTGTAAPDLAFSSTTVGTNTGTVVVTSTNASNSPQTGTTTVTVLDHAGPTLTIASGNNQSVITGATGITASLNLANGTTGDADRSAMTVQNLGTGLTGTTGAGVISSGASSTYAAALNTGTVGAGQSQVFTLDAGDQQNIPGASPLTTQSGTVTLNVYGHAAPTLSGTTFNLGYVHAGYGTAVTATQTATNGVAGNYIVDLKADGVSSGNLSVNGISGVSAGNSANVTATLATGQGLGAINETLTYTFADDSSLAGASNNVGTASLNITGFVYSGQGVWNSTTGGTWGTLASNFGVNWQTNGGTPGLDASFVDTDTATFGTAGAGIVTLDGAAPSLKGITFDNATASYELAQGTGGTITLNGGATAALIESVSGTHSISAPVDLATNTVIWVAADLLSFTADSVISGVGQLIKEGAGLLQLSGSNTYTGGTTVTTGTLQLGNGGASGSIVGDVTNDATLAFNRSDAFTFDGSISGGGQVVINQTGTLTLTGTSSYTGGTILTNGALLIGDDDAIGTGTLQLGNGTTFGVSAGSVILVNDLTIDGDISISLAGSAFLDIEGTVDLGAVTRTLTFTEDFSNICFMGEITGAGGLTLQMADPSISGLVTFCGADSNTFTGLTTVATGVELSLEKDPGAIALAGDLLVDVGGAVTLFDTSEQINPASTVTINGIMGILAISGTTTQTIGDLQGTGAIVNAFGESVITVNAGDFSGSILDGGASPLALIKATSGTLSLSGANAYRGGTTINAGRLQTTDSSALGSGPVALAGGSLAPVGEISITSLDWTGGTIASTLGTTTSFVNISGALTLTGVGQFDFTADGGFLANNPYAILTAVGLAGYTEADFGGTALLGLNPTFEIIGDTLFVSFNGATQGGTIQNGAPTFTPQTAMFVVNGSVFTGGPNDSNTIAGLIFTPGSSLQVFNNLTLTSGSLTVTSGSATITGGNIITPGAFTKLGTGLLNLLSNVFVNGNAFLNEGILAVNGNLTAQNLFVQLNAMLKGSGVIFGNVFNSGTVAPGNSPGTLTINGNFTQTGSGLLEIEIASLSDFDRVLISGNASLAGQLQVVSFDGFEFEYGQQFAFLQAGSISGAFDSIVTSDPSNFRARFLTSGGTGSILLAPTSYTLVAQTTNQQNVAAALDSYIPATSGDRQTVSLALDLLSAEQYPAAFEQIMPGFYESLTDITIEQAVMQNQMLAQRMSAVRLGARGFSAIGIESPLVNDKDGKSVLDAKDGKDILAPTIDNKWGVWVQGNGIFAKTVSASQVPNYHTEAGGFLVGADYRWSENFTTGVYLGYQGLYSRYTGGSNMSVNSALFGGYATYENGGFYADAIIGGGYNGYSARRSIEFSNIDRTARSNPNGGQFTTYLDLGYDWNAGGFTFGPIVSAQYTYSGVAPFTETGADSLDLRVGQQNANSIRTNIGGRIAYTWNVTDKIAFIPEVRLFWQHEFLQNPTNIGASLDGGNGPAFGYETSTPDRDSIFAGAGVSTQFGKNWNAYFFYNSDFARQDYLSHAISAGLNWKF